MSREPGAGVDDAAGGLAPRRGEAGSGRTLFLILVGLILVGLAALLFGPQAVERLAPEPLQAWVAIEAEGSGIARVGPVEMVSGTPFTLHAVLEAEGREGEPVYYTEAGRLALGDREVSPASLRRWDRRQVVKVLWFTVEGAVPFLKLESPADLDRFRAIEFLRLDWPRTWAAPGRIEPANDDALQRGPGADLPFGTQRYHVRIEIYDSEDSLVPRARYKSPDAGALAERPAEFPTARVALPGPAGPASRFFGLTGIGPPPGADPALLGRLAELTRLRLAYSPVPLLAELLAAAGRRSDELAWRRVDLQAGPAWGPEVGPGDLLQAGARWVVLYQDAGAPGVLDRDDLCFDFAARAAVRPLADVFTGEGELGRARLGG